MARSACENCWSGRCMIAGRRLWISTSKPTPWMTWSCFWWRGWRGRYRTCCGLIQTTYDDQQTPRKQHNLKHTPPSGRFADRSPGRKRSRRAWFRGRRCRSITEEKIPIYAITAFRVGFASGNSVVLLDNGSDEADDSMVSDPNPPTFIPYRIINTPISGMTLWLQCITSQCAGSCDAIANSLDPKDIQHCINIQKNREISTIYIGSAVCPKWYDPVNCLVWGAPGTDPGGTGRPNRRAGKASGTASNVTTGKPNVRPRKLLTEPPRECPASQTLEWGYNSVALL